MKVIYQKLLKKISQFFILGLTLLMSQKVSASDYYWVGGTGNWSDVATHWATTSGGSTFHVVSPTSNDNVFFDVNSFSGVSQVVTIGSNVGASCNNMDWTGVTNAPSFVLNNSFAQGLQIYGSLTFVAGMTTTFSQPTYFKSTSVGQTVTLGGKQLRWAYFDGVGGGWTLQDAFNTTEGVFLTNGSLNTNNNAMTVYYFSSNNSNIRSLNIGSSVCTFTYGQPWELGGTNLTFSNTTPTFSCVDGTFVGGNQNYSGANLTFSSTGTISGNNSFNNVTFALAGTINGNNTFNNVSIGGNATITGNNTFNDLSFGAGTTNTITAAKTQTVNGNLTSSSTCTGFATFTSSGTTTFSKSSGSVTFNYVSLNNILATGGATFTANNAIASGTNTGWTINGLSSNNLYWIGGTGNWSDGSHWSLTSGGGAYNCAPQSVDNVFFDVNSFSGASQVVTIGSNVGASCNNMNWTGVTNAPSFVLNNSFAQGLQIYGSLTFVAGMTTTFSQPTYFKSTSVGQTVTLGGKQLRWAYFDGVGGGWTWQDAFNASEGVFLTNGSLNTNNNAMTVYYFSSNNSNIRSLNIGSSVCTFTYGYPWELGGSNLTYTSSNPIFNVNGGGTFIGGGYVYNNINFNGSSAATIYGITSAQNVTFTGTGTISGPTTLNNVIFGSSATINGNNTFNNLSFYAGTTVTLQNGNTQTVNGILSATGTGGLPIILQSSSASAATISKSSGTVCLDYVQVQNITGTGGASFDAGSLTHSTNTGGNTGISFTGSCTLPTEVSYLWKGGSSTAWTTASNWAPAIIPTSTSYVVIQSANNLPIISTPADILNLTINSSASLTVTGTLNLYGTLSNSGTLTATAGTIAYTGSSAQTIAASTFAGNTVQNLTINNAAGVTLSGALKATGTVALTSGTFTTGSNLTITPTGAITGTINNVTGTVALQQNIIGQRGFRMFANPFTTAQNIANIATNSGTGTGITISTTPNAQSGLTDIRTYTNGSNNVWNNVTSATIPANIPYALFIRGLASEVNGLTYSGGPTPFTYNVTGTLNTSPFAVTPAAANFTLVGNPFAAPVNSSALTNGTGKSYYVYQIAVTGTPRVKAGGWSTVLSSSSTTPIPNLGVIAYQAGSATGYNVTTSDINTTNAATTGLFSQEKAIENLALVIEQNGIQQDNLFVRQDAASTAKSTDSKDLEKLVNDNLNFYIINKEDNTRLAVDARNLNSQTGTTTIPVGISAIQGSYTIKVGNNNIANTTAMLRDKYLQTETTLTEATTYSFNITADAASKGEERFELVFNSTKPTVSTIDVAAINGAFTAKVLGNISTNNNITLQIQNAQTPVTITVTDVLGKVLKTQVGNNGTNKVQLSKVTGMYFVSITDGKTVVTEKVIK